MPLQYNTTIYKVAIYQQIKLRFHELFEILEHN